MLTLVASREQQDRNIGATDQQKRSHRAQQEIKRSSERPGIYVDNAGHFHLEAVRIFCWRLLSKLLQNGLQLGACLRRLHPGAEFERSGKMDVWVLCNLQRNINVRGAPLKTRRHHANDLVGLVHQLHGAADDVGIAHKVALPKLVGQHHDGLRRLSRRSVGRNQPAPLQRANAPVTRCVWRNVHGLHVFR